MPPRVIRRSRRRYHELILSAASSGIIYPECREAYPSAVSIDTSILANAVFTEAHRLTQRDDRDSSVFYAPRSASESFDDAVRAVFWTGCAGFALLILSKPFQGNERCVTELLKLVDVHQEVADGLGVNFMLVFIGISREEFLHDTRIQSHALFLTQNSFELVSIYSLSGVPPVTYIVDAIVALVVDAWLLQSQPNVFGATARGSALDFLRGLFNEQDVPLAKRVLDMDDSSVTTIKQVIGAALADLRTGSDCDGFVLFEKLARTMAPSYPKAIEKRPQTMSASG